MEEESYRPLLIRIAAILGIWLFVALFATACSKPDNDELASLPDYTAESTPRILERPISPAPKLISQQTQDFVDNLGIEFAYDKNVFGPHDVPAIRPHFSPKDGSPVPQHIEITFQNDDDADQIRLQIFPKENLKNLSGNAATHIANLEYYLGQKPDGVDLMPFFPSINANQIGSSPPEIVDFQNGHGLGFVLISDEDDDPLNDSSLNYTFQGVTTDKKYLVSITYPLDDGGNLLPAIAAMGGTYLGSTDIGEFDAQVAAIYQENSQLISQVNAAIESLYISPGLHLPANHEQYIVYPGFLMVANEEFLDRDSTNYKRPAVFLDESTKGVFSKSVPDIIETVFAKDGELPGTLTINPIKNSQDGYWPGLPTSLKDQIRIIAEVINGNLDPKVYLGNASSYKPLDFTSGQGFRWIKSMENDRGDEQEYYRFDGITKDGRYFIQFDYPLTSSSNNLLIDKLDHSLATLVIDPEISTTSSYPDNPAGCTNEAEFVADVTIPDNTVIERGKKFQKIWRVKNIGSCTWTPEYDIQVAGGNPLSWQPDPIMYYVEPGEETEISVVITSPEIKGTYQAWWRIADDMGEQFSPPTYVLFEAPQPATDIPGYGVIEGKISYPAGGMPSMTIYFLRTDGSERYALTTDKGWVKYNNQIPVGEYYVFARVAGDESDTGGGFTAAVRCGLHKSCENHSLVPVVIEEAKATREINILDWYAPAGSFPLP